MLNRLLPHKYLRAQRRSGFWRMRLLAGTPFVSYLADAAVSVAGARVDHARVSASAAESAHKQLFVGIQNR
jgi:hypothetical protein